MHKIRRVVKENSIGGEALANIAAGIAGSEAVHNGSLKAMI